MGAHALYLMAVDPAGSALTVEALDLHLPNPAEWFGNRIEPPMSVPCNVGFSSGYRIDRVDVTRILCSTPQV